MKSAKAFLVSGKVQGVFFRSSTRFEAELQGVSGWVRNLENGQVDGEVHGEQARVDKLVEWLAHGPGMAKVEKLELRDIPFAAQDEFKIL